MLVRAGVHIIKYWFSISDEEQYLRFQMRIHDPLKQRKLSPMDLESCRLLEQYTKAKEDMLRRTHIPEARWWKIEADEKKGARLNCIHHLLYQFECEEVRRPSVTLPIRQHSDSYKRKDPPDEMYVPNAH